MTLQTPLHDWHVAHNGRMVDFAGWQMPVQYKAGLVAEHHAVRRHAGLFDISHMGRLIFTGPQAAQAVNHIVTVDVERLKPGRIKYALVTNEQGGILDDVLVYRLENRWLMVVNASNREKIVSWIDRQCAAFDFECEDRTADDAMIAVQGPAALELLRPLTTGMESIRYYASQEILACGVPSLVSRTGYTGEDGFELILPSDRVVAVWDQLLEAGQAVPITPCGLGARDTLRLEAAMPLYGHELSETIDPLTAGLNFAVHLDGADFIGRDSLLALQKRTDLRRRVGLVVSSRRVAREGAALLQNGTPVGEVTSGTFSPTLEHPIAMAYVDAAVSAVGTELQVDIRGKQEPAKIVELPFYQRPKT